MRAHAFFVAVAILAAPSVARATGKVQHPVVVVEPELEPELAVAAPSPEPPEPPPTFDAGDRQRKWAFEAHLGPTVTGIVNGIADDGSERFASAVGVRSSMMFARRLEYKPGGCYGDEMTCIFASIFSLGITLIPPSAWIGTEIGAAIELQYAATSGEPLRQRLVVAARPVLRVSPPDSRFRYPAILHLLSPAIGLAVDAPVNGVFPNVRRGFYVRTHSFPFSVLLMRHVGLELEPSAAFIVHGRDVEPRVELTPQLSATLFVRETK